MQKHFDAITSGQYVAQILKRSDQRIRRHTRFSISHRLGSVPAVATQGLGKRILCTDNAWSDQDIILASRAQHHVERAFKQMKNPHWVSFSPAFLDCA